MVETSNATIGLGSGVHISVHVYMLDQISQVLQPRVGRISGQLSSLQGTLLVLVISYTISYTGKVLAGGVPCFVHADCTEYLSNLHMIRPITLLIHVIMQKLGKLFPRMHGE